MESKGRIRVGVVLIKEGKVLVIRMYRENSEDIYVFPGGGVDGGEDIFSAAIRETKEETNLDIDIKKILYLKSLYAKDNDNALEIVLLGNIIGGELEKGHDPEDKGKNVLKEVLFVDIKNLHNLNFHPKQLRNLLKDDFRSNFEVDTRYLGNYKYPENP